MKMISLSKTVSFTAQEYAGQGNALLGIRGSGKSYSATFFAEQLTESKIPFVAFDPIGTWRFLKTPGRGPGFSIVVAGGEHGDLPLSKQTAPEIVRAAMQANVPLVIDLYSMELSKRDWRDIVESCVRLLLYENKRHGLRHIFFEEAAEFCPQRIGPDQGRVYAEIEKLARMGRNASLGYTLINQRSEEVNKAVLELCDCLFLHRQKGRNSLTALEKWLHFGNSSKAKEIVNAIPTLDQGECFAWLPGSESPEFVKMPTKRTFHPDPSKPELADQAGRSQVDVTSFVSQLKTSLTKASQPKTPKPIAPKATVMVTDQAQIQAAYDRGCRDTRNQFVRKVEAARVTIEKVHLATDNAIRAVGELVGFAREKVEASKPVTAPSPISQTAPAERNLHSVAAVPAGSVSEGGMRRLMVALAQRPGLNPRQLTARAGISLKSSTYRGHMAKMRASGYLDESSGTFKLTAEGLAAVGDFKPLPEGRDLVAWWIAELGNHGAARVLNALLDNFGHSLSKEDLASRVGVLTSSSTWRGYLAKLRSYELIDGSGTIGLAPELLK